MPFIDEIWSRERALENDWARFYDFVYDELQPAYRLHKQRAAAMVHQVWKTNPGVVMEIGCGTGAVLRCVRDAGVPECDLWGVDISDEMVRTAAGHLPAARFTVSPFEALKISEPIHVAYFCGALHHLPDPALVAAKLREAIRPRGFLIVCEPNESWLFENVWVNRAARAFNPFWLYLWLRNRTTFAKLKNIVKQMGESPFHVHMNAASVAAIFADGFRLVRRRTDFGVTRLFESVIPRPGPALSGVRRADAVLRRIAPAGGGAIEMVFQRL